MKKKAAGATKTAQRRFWWILLAVYLALLTAIILLKLGLVFAAKPGRELILEPFRFQRLVPGILPWLEVLLNIVLFLPYAFLLGKASGFSGNGKILLVIFLTSLLFESLQYALAIGVSDVTDLMTNTLGGALGLGAYRTAEKMRARATAD